ncbi:three-helix bundle dimerization domain-containing protein [Pseudonocardia alni]|uniref:three-helix bundle dimerization domain-containing protein n=1 Tax=Pseudonocardia TaxID=1847 RepID=UPI0006CB15CC|nr:MULTISPECIES: hypothetical protein [unclassified Pseudonocardia]ALE77984.1 hypothetical protein WY02_05545 [Pseudonocardia sp. AL041005-10]MCO7196698.1 hypothetical protein [Pseudonocardia sp. McavD-2-B]
MLVDETVRRLSAEFTGDVERRTVRAVVRRGRTDLAGAPVGALPELLERLARERLRDLCP